MTALKLAKLLRKFGFVACSGQNIWWNKKTKKLTSSKGPRYSGERQLTWQEAKLLFKKAS